MRKVPLLPAASSVLTLLHHVLTKSIADLRTVQPRAQLEVRHVCFILKIQTSYYKGPGQPGAAMGKPLGGVCEPSQPRCGYSSAGLRLMTGVGLSLHRNEGRSYSIFSLTL